MDKSMKIVRNFQFKGIMSNAVDNIIPTGYVPDMQNLKVSLEGLAQNIKIPSEWTVPWVAWQATHAYILGDVVVAITGQYAGCFYVCTAWGSVPHHSGGSEPTWNNTTVTDGDITWTYGDSKTNPIVSFYHEQEITEVFAIQIGKAVVLFEGANQPSGHIFTTVDLCAFSSGASNTNVLYIMHYIDGLWKYSHPTWTDVSHPTDPVTVGEIDYSGGTPPKSQGIFAYHDRLWAYGWLKEGLDSTGAVSRLHFSEIPSLPENHVKMTYDISGSYSADNPNPLFPAGSQINPTHDPTHDQNLRGIGGLDTVTPAAAYKVKDSATVESVTIDGQSYWNNTLTYDQTGNDYFDPEYFVDVSSIGNDQITGVIPYNQALYIFTPANVYTFAFITTDATTNSLQQVAAQIDGIPNRPGYDVVGNFVTAGKGIYYIGSKGLYTLETPSPVKISLPVQNLIDLVIGSPKGVCYFNDEVWFALSSEVWVFNVAAGTWRKHVYPFQVVTIWATDHVYATTTLGKVYELDTEASTYLTWYMDTPKADLGNLYLDKRPEDIVVSLRVPTASSTISIVMTDETNTSTTIATAETFIAGRTELLNEIHYPIYKGIVKDVSFRLSGSGEVKLLGYDVNYKLYHRKRI